VGYGAYSYEAHRALASERAAQPVQQVFAQRQCHPLMNPHGVTVRESRDSPEHPESLAVAFALDVTGSMGAIPDALARRELPEFVKMLTDLGVVHPQVLFMAVGDAVGDKAPLQVGQFESTAERMDQWLTWSWLEGGGGAGECESYELALYFAAQHIDMDCFRKRSRHGYLFLTGDEKPYPLLSRHTVKEVFGDAVDADVPLPALVNELSHAFEPFFLIPDLERRQRVERTWRDLLGDRVIALEHPDDVCLVAASLVALGERLTSLDGLAARFVKQHRQRVGRLIRALTPFAASIGLDDAPAPACEKARLPIGGASGYRRLDR
jgi:predicted protein tyrosine phosphatase